MSAVIIEPMGDAAQWTAVAPDGVTPSDTIALDDDQVIIGTGADGVSGRITATADALGHALRRTRPPLDISAYTELRLSIRGSRPAGTPEAPFLLELRLASAAMPLSEPANTWHRLLPVRAPRRWETVRLSLDDLPPAVATALTVLQLRCLSGETPFTVHLDDVVAVRPELLADTDRALVALLSGITVDGGAVTVAVRAPAEPAPAPPGLDIMNVDVRFAPGRVHQTAAARDFTVAGARHAPPGDPYDLDYVVTPVADTRAKQAALVEAVLDRLSPQDELVVDGERFPVQLVWIEGTDRPGGSAGTTPVLRYRIGARTAPLPGSPVTGVHDIRIDTGHLETL